MPHHVFSDINHGILEKYTSKIFVLTGVGRGVNIDSALFAEKSEIYAMDEEIILVEHMIKIVPIMINSGRNRPKKIRLFHGVPKSELYIMIEDVQQPAIFLLSSYMHDPDNKDKAFDIIDELEQIKIHPLKNHTILIDYLSPETACFGNLSIEMVKTKLLEINPNYSFKFEQGGHLGCEDNAVLVAYIA